MTTMSADTLHTVESVTLDGITPHVLAQHRPDVRWNGWLCPSMDALAAVTVLDALAAIPHERDLSYDFTDDGTLLVTETDSQESFTESYEPDEDGLYALGAWGWVWSADTTWED